MPEQSINEQTRQMMGMPTSGDPAIIDPTTGRPYTPDASVRQQEEITRQAEVKEEFNLLQDEKRANVRDEAKISTLLETPETENLAEEITEDLNQLKDPLSSIRPKVRPKELEQKVGKLYQSAVKKAIELDYISKEEGGEEFDGYRGTKSNLRELEPKNLPTITKFITQALGVFDPNQDVTKAGVYWCAAFVNHILTEMGADTLGKGDRYRRLRAQEYINYGQEISFDDMQEGDILLFGVPELGKVTHVGFYTGERDGEYVNMLGGNQRSEKSLGELVNIVPRSLKDIVGVRRVTYDGDAAKIIKDQKGDNSIFRYFDTDTYSASFIPSESRKYNEGGDVAAQMDLMLPSADEDTRSTKEFLQHPLKTVPYFKRPMGSSTDDPQVGQDDAGNPVFKGRFGEYTVRVNPDQRTLRTKVKEAIPVVKEAVGEYLEDPKLPTKDQLSEFAKQAGQSAVESVEDLGDLMLKGKGTYGDVVGLAIGAGTGSIPFSVPEGAIRTFGGATPPTYQKREAPLFSLSTSPDEVLDIYNMGLLIFREPVVEFAETLDIPKKGLLGSEFLNQIKKNPSIPETSLQESVIEPSKRYTKEELLRALGVQATNRYGATTKGTFRSVANISPARIKQFERYQRQGKDAGFVGGTEIDYFDIPLDVTIGYPGKKFKAHSQHYQDETLVHVRGSILNSNPLPDRNLVAFDTIIDDDNFLLVEEIQSDLLTKGYVKPKSPFDAAFSEAIEEYDFENPVKYQEAYGDISTDIQKIFKELDEEGIYSPELPIQLESLNSNPFFSPETETAFTNKIWGKGYTTFEELRDYIKSQNTNSESIWGILSRLQDKVPDVSVVNDAPGGKTYTNISLDLDDPAFDDFLETFYGSVKGSEIDHDILMYKYEDFIDDYNEVLLKKIKEKGLSKELDLNDLQRLREKYEESGAKGTLSVGLPPIRKNKQAVDEALKVLIAKAAQQGVDKIVIPPAERIAMARGRELKKDKGDRFYRTYVTDLNKSLKELEDNYPVVVHRDVELPYLKESDPDAGDFEDLDMEAALQAAIDAEDPEAAGDIAELIQTGGKRLNAGNKGTILDISELIDKYKIEQPRQFAKGGVAMNEQMEMAFMQQGGLKDDGMKRDPVSGNEVPNGSMAKEVRDDIPAQLSEGEYVVPADVVRYLGVKHFEDLRNKAKSGLQNMEANGRIGGEPVPVGGPQAAPMPQPPTPYMAEGGDLTPDEMNEIKMLMSQGGMVAGAAEGADFGQKFMTQPSVYGGGFSWEDTPGGTPSGVSIADPELPTETPESCELRGMVYNPETKMCEVPIEASPVGISGGDDSSVSDDEGEDSTTWMDSYDYTDFNNLAQQTSAALDGPTTMLGSAAEMIFGGGVLGKLAKASNAAQVAANIAVLKAQAETDPSLEGTVAELTTKFNNYVSSNNLGGLKNFITGKNLAKQINKTQVDVGLFEESTDVFGNKIFKDKDEFNKQLQDNAPAGMVYKPDQGAYIRPPGVSAAPSTSIRPEGGFAAAKAAATPISKPANPSQDPYRENRDPGPSGTEVAREASQASTASSASKAKAMSTARQKGGVSASTAAKLSGSQMKAGSGVGSGVGGSNYAGPMNKGGLMLKKKKSKEK